VQGVLDRRSLHRHSPPRPDRGLLWLSPERLRHRKAGGLHDVCVQRLQRQLRGLFLRRADYRFNKHFDAYLGAMYSGVHDGVASGYLNTTNINPTVGVRYKF